MGYDAGYPAANYGVSLVKSEYVFLINPDTFPTSKCIEKLENFADIRKESPLFFPLKLEKTIKFQMILVILMEKQLKILAMKK